MCRLVPAARPVTSARDDHEGAVLDDTPRSDCDSGYLPKMAEKEEVLGKVSDELARYVVMIFACLIYSYCIALFWCSFARDFSILDFIAKICYNYIYVCFSLSLLNVLLCYLHVTH